MKPLDMNEILQMLYVVQLLADPEISQADRNELLDTLRGQRSRVAQVLKTLGPSPK